MGAFRLFNVVGGLSWVLLFIWGGYLFGNIPIIKNNFGIVTIAIIVVSVMPAVIAFLRRKKPSIAGRLRAAPSALLPEGPRVRIRQLVVASHGDAVPAFVLAVVERRVRLTQHLGRGSVGARLLPRASAATPKLDVTARSPDAQRHRRRRALRANLLRDDRRAAASVSGSTITNSSPP